MNMVETAAGKPAFLTPATALSAADLTFALGCT
jgi:hypothetical protein